ncbi:MAG: sigma 54-dependent Fis family transcriptional regulator [Kofleriaceae bacterium]|nr:sigma 54-dependent Fis family transcriptional regulator [Myxococcales bacterium]MCB9560010.1 sigma 54-dependent Fis family transcriptional regulator [Kofleriaceae bacterium]MCB9571939.1 sigma 54-dependent Fis family transcriptional regulator [Kofleriaceae bacterium]
MPVDDLRSGTWVTFIGGRAAGVRVRRCRVEVVAGPDAGLVRDIESAVIRVGARRGNDVQLSDAKVSGLHCEIRLDERGYRLRDLDSTNGTFVSGLRINDVYVQPGAQIALGGTRLRFEPLGESVEVELSERDRFGTMSGRSVKMRELFARLEKLSHTDTTVLITGETGVGKELVAEALHETGDRAEGPFVVVDCGSIPPNLIESELFGHERGAFTGATGNYAGAFERAHQGTIFLDEIGELPLAMQPKLLRVLERKEVRRVGGTRTIEVDIRVVAATNRDLGVEVNRGRFREDLFYRLAVARVHVPPLRERKDDIPLLIEHILANTPGGEGAHITPDTVELMMKHDWPGNVRELRNVIERAVLLAESPVNEAALRRAPAMPQPTRSETATPSSTITPPDAQFAVPVDIQQPFKHAKQAVISEFERRYISKLLEHHDGNISAAARAAGIDRMSIHKMLHRLGLSNPGREDE